MMLLVTRLPMSMSKFAWSEKVGGALSQIGILQEPLHHFGLIFWYRGNLL